jgi:lipoprotein-anchoring transpeptidase ErfK/SrfK
MGRRWVLASRVLVASSAAASLVLANSPAGRTAARLSDPVVRPAPVVATSTAAADVAELRRALPATAAAPERPPRHLLVHIERSMPVTSRQGRGRTVGMMPASSLQFHFPTVAWVLERSGNRRFGKVTVPYSGTRRTGWIALKGLEHAHTSVMVRIDRSRHRLTVLKGNRVIIRFPAATGAPWSPTPTGRFFVTDRVPFARGSYYGSFAFGISDVQTRLPPGWSGGSQLAIHGTNNPASIGRSVSAGCLRVSERALSRLKPLLRLGTPVVIVP